MSGERATSARGGRAAPAGRGGSLAAGRGRASVLEAAASLWPDSSAAEVTWRAGDADVTRSFRVVPSLARPRYLMPGATAAAAALPHTEPGLRSLPIRLLSHLQRSGLLHRLPGPRLHVGPTHAAGIEAVLSEVLGEVGSVVVRIGRPRPHRALVLWALDPAGAPLAVVKLGRGGVAHASLEREFFALATLAERPVPGLVVPRALAYLRWSGADLLVLSVLEAERPRRLHQPPVAAMTAFVESAGVEKAILSESALVDRLSGDIAALGDAAGRVWLRAELDRTLADLGHVVVPATAWHGDWAPWNMTLETDSVLLWDWEHYEEAALAGFDHIHFLAQHARRSGTDAGDEDAWLTRAGAALRETWGLDEAQQAAVLRCYLIEVNLRYLAERQDEEQPPPGRRGWGRPLVERLREQTASAVV